jgi:hydrogenase assembly chaperone HypC/HupF
MSMCIAVPGKVLGASQGRARVDFFGRVAEVESRLVNVKTGDYVLAFGGSVLERVSKERAEEIARTLGAGWGHEADGDSR